MVDIRNRYWALIVEDDPDQVTLIKAVFAHFDANAYINVANSAEQAIAYIKGPWPNPDLDGSETPDVIVLDIKMEGMGGLGFLEWYASEPKMAHVPIVVFTSSEDAELERQCLALGAREFKVKPADYGELVTIVQHMLNRWQPREGQSDVANGPTHHVGLSAPARLARGSCSTGLLGYEEAMRFPRVGDSLAAASRGAERERYAK